MTGLEDAPGHVQWLATHRGQALKARLAADGIALDIAQALGLLVQADPTPALHATQWLCDSYIAGGLLWEDVLGGVDSKAGETLTWFVQHRSRLPRPARNLAIYSGLGDVYKAIEHLLPKPDDDHEATPAGRALRRQQRAQAYDESIILHESDDLIMAVPTTQAAAIWWGRGTRWCTAALNYNYFHYYNRDAPLIVVVLPRIAGAKLQLHVSPKGIIQFMDAADRTVPPQFVHDNWHTLSRLVEWMLPRSAMALVYVPLHCQTSTMCWDSVSRNPSMIERVRPDLLHSGMCQHVARNHARGLSMVPAQYLTTELCEQAVLAQPAALEFVPTPLQTRTMCLNAVKGSPGQIRHVRQDFLTRAMCLSAVGGHGLDLAHVPIHMQDLAIVVGALLNNGLALQHVGPDWLSPYICRLAVEQNGLALEYVRPELKDQALCRAAVRQDINAMAFVPSNLAAKDLYPSRRSLTGANLGIIPPYLLDHKMCLQAVKVHLRALQHVPEHMRSREVCLAAVNNSGDNIKHVPPHLLTPGFYMAFIKSYGGNLRHLDEHARTAALSMAAVQRSGRALQWVPQHLKTHDLCLAASRRDGGALEYVPVEMQTEAMCMAAVYEQPCALKYARGDLRTLAVCMLALQRAQGSSYNAETPAWVPLAIRRQVRKGPDLASLAALLVRRGLYSGMRLSLIRAWSNPRLRKGEWRSTRSWSASDLDGLV